MVDNCNNSNNIKYIFTEVNSLKILKGKLGVLSGSKNIFIDSENTLNYSLVGDNDHSPIF